MNISFYKICALLFFLVFLAGIKLMNSPRTAVKGNLLGAFGMLGAIIVTLMSNAILGYGVLWLSLAVGGIIGYVLAINITMIKMPQLVALLNGIGGGASTVTAFVALTASLSNNTMARLAAGLAMAVGGVTFSGSIISAAKLDNRITQKPVALNGHTFLLITNVLLMVILIVFITLGSESKTILLSIITVMVTLLFGVLFTIRVGGADMPVTISLLNSFSGLAGSIAGFAVNNPLLVTVGAIVGSAGLILTRIMCHAMNRTLLEVLTGKTTLSSLKSATSKDMNDVSTDRGLIEFTINDKKKNLLKAVSFLRQADKIVFVPGYGMALSQAQSKVKQLSDILEKHGKEVKFAIHPVAGRMPGHMNVLLAEVDVSYDKLYEMNDINPTFKETDIVIVVGANDVVNLAATTAEGTPIYGMPILKVNKAKHIIIFNKDTDPGYSGVDNPLYEKGNVTLILGDASQTVGELLEVMAF